MKKDRLFTSLLVALLLATTNIGTASERMLIGEGESLNIHEMTFENLETEDFGGAIENNGTLSVDNSNFRNNSAHKTNTNSFETSSETYVTGNGGAIYNAVNAELSVNNSIFENNLADNGGAIYNEGTIKEIVSATFKGNRALNETITISDYSWQDGDITITGYTNSKGNSGYGGAIYNTNGNLNISDSHFEKNVAADGGAIFHDESDTNGLLNIKNSKFINNSSYNEDSESGTLTVGDKTYTWNNEHYGLGSGGAIVSYKDTTIENSEFIGNTTGGDGGAIYASKNLTVKNSLFKDNVAKAHNIGTYYRYESDGKVEKIDYDYDDGYGGAISHGNGNLLIENSVFENNCAGGENGGAISSDGQMQIVDTRFTSNSSTGNGGAVDGKNTIVTGSNFDRNSASHGGALNIIGDVSVENSTFEGNISREKGGAIFNVGNNITVKNSTFTDNAAKSETESGGGAIYAYGEDIYGIYTDPEPYSESDTPSTPVAPTFMNSKLTVENSNFENNIAGDEGGGAIISQCSTQIIDSVFMGNHTTGSGGAIKTTMGLNVTDTDFTNNTAKDGGAIYAKIGDEFTDLIETMEDMRIPAGIHITALNKDVAFSGNTAEKGGDIYLENQMLYINANKNKTISFDGGIVGKNSSIIINDQTKQLYDDMSSTGKIVIDNFVSSDENSTLAINHKAGTLALTNEKYLDGTDLTLEEGSTLDLTNKSIGTMNLNSLTSNNANLDIDADLANSENVFDTITVKTATGTLNLKNVNLISDFSDDQNEINVTLPQSEGFELKLPESGISAITKDYVYNIDTTDGNLSVNRLVDDEGNAVKTDGFTVAINQTDKIGGVDVELSQDRSFSASEDIKITGNNSKKGWTGNLGGKSLTINGNGYTLDGEEHIGIAVDDNQLLTLNDTNIKGFKTSERQKGTLTVNNGGTLHINALNYDISLGENYDSDIIYLDGTTSSANLLTENEKEINVNGNIISANKSNNLLLSGNGKITFNGIVDPLTLTNENKETVHNNYIDDVTYNLNSGTVTFTKDEYLNGQGNKNTLNFNGGTLNLANGAVGTINLAALNINSNSNIMVDADLAKETMDSFTADSATAAKDAILNVSHINLLSDAVKDTVEINAVDPAITLGENDTLASHIATSVKEVAYSPLYKYGVGYDPTTGNFTFSRGSSKNYNNVNPSVMVSPVAAQLGGYMGMIDTYNNAFSNMDMRMLLPSSVRIAQKNANKYAITDTKGADFATNETNSGGTWVRPFAAYDSVGLKNGPKVHNMSYGSFIGGDTAVHQFANGAEGVLSAHVSYLGSHQSFAGNSIYQNGGNIGLTGTLYKGNFFSGLSLNTGASVADASTMYGNEDFPMFMAGVANKTGYNIEFKEGKFIIQPSLLLSYTFVNTFNYTNASGIKIDGDPLHALQISPNVRFAFNTKNGWQPYLTAGMNWNIMNSSEFMANAAELPSLSVKPYVQYGFGLQKTVNDNFTAYAQVLLRNGGRNGIAANAGMKYLFGHESRIKENI